LRDGAGELLDQALVLWLPGPHSYSGEDSAELHLHAGPAVIDGVADRLVQLGGRPAEPGEFTRRAFLNGRMDLIEAEAVADLVAAETAAQRRQALRQLGGELGAVVQDWADRMVQLLAEQEALIDFPEEDLPPEIERSIQARLAELRGELHRSLTDGHRAERLRDGLVFALAGPPNVGKSTLLNALAGRDVAIVSPVPGTTRDALETRIVLGGVPVTLVDTAGLRATDDPVEREGVRRALARAESADLVVEVSAPDCVPASLPAGGASGCPILRVLNKVDLLPEANPIRGALGVSARGGTGLDALRETLAAHARALAIVGGSAPLTRARHRAALQDAAASLETAIAAPRPELRAEDLRLAVRAIGRLTGHVDVEDVLDLVFGQFCIGK
jgi:tRNA modification GTPase